MIVLGVQSVTDTGKSYFCNGSEGISTTPEHWFETGYPMFFIHVVVQYGKVSFLLPKGKWNGRRTSNHTYVHWLGRTWYFWSSISDLVKGIFTSSLFCLSRTRGLWEYLVRWHSSVLKCPISLFKEVPNIVEKPRNRMGLCKLILINFSSENSFDRRSLILFV